VRIVRFPLSGGPPSTIACVSYEHNHTLWPCHHPLFASICGNYAIIEKPNIPNCVILLKLCPLSYRTFELPSVRFPYNRLLQFTYVELIFYVHRLTPKLSLLLDKSSSQNLMNPASA
jgi:hypothetical protein